MNALAAAEAEGVSVERGTEAYQRILDNGLSGIPGDASLAGAIGHTDTPAVAPKPARAKPVKGLCANCGKNWSRHHVRGSAEYPYCSTTSTEVFALPIVVPPVPATPAPAVPGALTEAQVRELDSRIDSTIRTREVMHKAIAESDKAQKYYEDYLRSLTAK